MSCGVIHDIVPSVLPDLTQHLLYFGAHLIFFLPLGEIFVTLRIHNCQFPKPEKTYNL